MQEKKKKKIYKTRGAVCITSLRESNNFLARTEICKIGGNKSSDTKKNINKDLNLSVIRSFLKTFHYRYQQNCFSFVHYLLNLLPFYSLA